MTVNGSPKVIAHLVELGTTVAHPLVTPVVRIGRDPQNEILVRDATVSRLHAEVRSAFGVRTLSIMGSTGARVNDERVDAPVMLTQGDLIEIGSRRFTYHEGELPVGVMSYVGHGQEAQADPTLTHTTQSNPVVRPDEPPLGMSAKPGRDWGNLVLVLIAFLFGCCVYLGGMPR